MAEQPTNYNAAQNSESNAPVIKGHVKIEKPSFGKRIVNFLFSDKLDSVGKYLADAILGPSLKDLVFKIGMGALQMTLYGGNMYNPGNYSGGSYINGYGYQSARRDPVPYNTMSAPPGYQYGYAQPQPGIMAPKIDMSMISFDTKDDAWLILDRMQREIARYQKVRVADFYTYAGITGQEGNWTLSSTGWYNLQDAHPVMRTDGRWIIDFPPVQSI
jgi:hypothetical protein